MQKPPLHEFSVFGTTQTVALSFLRACLFDQQETVILFLVRRDQEKGDIAGQKTGRNLLFQLRCNN
jgi:hypothetical protein